MQAFFGSAIVTLTVAGSFVVAFVMQKTALGFLLKAMARNHGEPEAVSRVSRNLDIG